MSNELEILESMYDQASRLSEIDKHWSGDISMLIPWGESVVTGEPDFTCDCGQYILVYIPVFYGLPHQCQGCGKAYKPHIDGVELLRTKGADDE